MSIIRHAKSAIRSAYVRSLGMRAANGLLLFAISVLLARLLGPTEFGRYGILLSTAVILAIPFKAGLPRALTREIAAARVDEDNGRIYGTIRMGTVTFLAILPLLMLVTLALWAAGLEVAGMTKGIFVAALLAPLLAADANRMAAMQGLGSAVRSQVPDLLIRPIGTAAIVVGLLLTLGHATAITGAFAYSASTLLGFVVGALMLRRSLSRYTRTTPKRHVGAGTFLAAVGTLSILGGAKTVTGNIDLILTGQLVDLPSAGQYKVALSGLAVVIMGLTAIQMVVYTRLAEAVPANDKLSIVKHVDKAISWQVLLTAGVLGMVLLVGKPMIRIIYGQDYVEAWPILTILSVGFLIVAACGPAEEILMLGGKQLLAASIIIAGIILTVLLAILLIPSFGTTGIAIASAAGTAFRSIILTLMAQREIGVSTNIFGTLSRRLRGR